MGHCTLRLLPDLGPCSAKVSVWVGQVFILVGTKPTLLPGEVFCSCNGALAGTRLRSELVVQLNQPCPHKLERIALLGRNPGGDWHREW